MGASSYLVIELLKLSSCIQGKLRHNAHSASISLKGLFLSKADDSLLFAKTLGLTSRNMCRVAR